MTENRTSSRKTRVGLVVSVKMGKTVVVLGRLSEPDEALDVR